VSPGRRTGDIWPDVLSKSISGWIVAIAVPASIALAWYLRTAVVAEWHIQASYPALEAQVAAHELELKALKAQAMPPDMLGRWDDFLRDYETAKKKKAKP